MWTNFLMLCAHFIGTEMDFPFGPVVENLPAGAGDKVQPLDWEEPLEKEMAAHSSILAWEIPWTEKPSGLQFIGSQNSQTYLGTTQGQLVQKRLKQEKRLIVMLVSKMLNIKE